MSVYQRIYAVVRRIPRGSVASYGRIARMVGCPARQVGYAMAAASPAQGIPWHRIINSRGEISARKNGGGDDAQKQKLLREGVIFAQNGRVDFAQFGWIEDVGVGVDVGDDVDVDANDAKAGDVDGGDVN